MVASSLASYTGSVLLLPLLKHQSSDTDHFSALSLSSLTRHFVFGPLVAVTRPDSLYTTHTLNWAGRANYLQHQCPDHHNLVFANRSFSQAAPTLWNNLPQRTISDLSSLTSFE